MDFGLPPNAAGIQPPANPQRPPILVDITNSKEYIERLSHSKESEVIGAATDVEIGAAERYKHELVLANSLGGIGGPAWVQLLGAVNQILGDVNQIRGSLQRVEAYQQNARIGHFNKMELVNNTGVTVYRAKQKEIAGDGTELANALLPPNIAPLEALQTAPVYGEFIAPMINTRTLTHQIILYIIQFYNNSFGIELGDTVSVRSQKIANWLTMDV